MSFFDEKPEQPQPQRSTQEGSAATSPDWEELQRNRVPYQTSLQMIGAFLDDENACRANVIEIVDGFSLRFQRLGNDPALHVRSVPYAGVATLSAEIERKGRRGAFGFGKKNNAGRYRNTLRALGYELDGVQAYGLLIDDVDEGFLVTYQYLNPTQGFMVRKRMVFLDLNSIDRVLLGARERRGGDKSTRPTLLAG